MTPKSLDMSGPSTSTSSDHPIFVLVKPHFFRCQSVARELEFDPALGLSHTVDGWEPWPGGCYHSSARPSSCSPSVLHPVREEKKIRTSERKRVVGANGKGWKATQASQRRTKEICWVTKDCSPDSHPGVQLFSLPRKVL